MAVVKGHLEIVKYLVGKGSDIHALDDVPLKLAAREGHLKTFKYLLKIIFKENSPILNINQKNKNGDRLIDFVTKVGDNDLIIKFRNLGSVEPKFPVLNSGKNSQKLDISNGRLDGYEPNQRNVFKVLNLLYKKFPLGGKVEIKNSDGEVVVVDKLSESEHMDYLINQFKEKLPKDSSEFLIEKIDNLCKSDCSWSFKKALASIIYLVNQQNNDDLNDKLILYINALNSCHKGQLINLLHLVQDYILDVKEIDYTAFQFEDYEGFFESIYSQLI